MAYMEKKEVGTTKFWQVCMKDCLVSMRFGTKGSDGVRRTKTFGSQQEAVQFLVTQVLGKQDAGFKVKKNNSIKRKYDDLSDGSSSNSEKQSVNSKSKEKVNKKKTSEIAPPAYSNNYYGKKKRGLSGCVPPDCSGPLGHIDPESRLQGHIYKNFKGEAFDVMLTKQNTANNSYYIIQLIQYLHNGKLQYKVYLRWGRMNTAGQCQVLHSNNLKDALEEFEDKFWEKTGLEWHQRYETDKHYKDMYRWIKPVQSLQQTSDNSITLRENVANEQVQQQSNKTNKASEKNGINNYDKQNDQDAMQTLQPVSIEA